MDDDKSICIRLYIRLTAKQISRYVRVEDDGQFMHIIHISIEFNDNDTIIQIIM